MELRNKGNTFLTEMTEYQAGPGSRLKAKREQLGWSIEQVTEQIPLTAQAIRDLEENRYYRFSAIVFIRGYLRAYARLLDLGIEEILEDFDKLGLTDQTAKNSIDNTAYAPHRELTDKMVPWAVLIGGTLVLLIGLFWWHLQRENRENLNQVEIKKTSTVMLTNNHTDGNHEIVLQGEPDPLQPIKNVADKQKVIAENSSVVLSNSEKHQTKQLTTSSNSENSEVNHDKKLAENHGHQASTTSSEENSTDDADDNNADDSNDSAVVASANSTTDHHEHADASQEEKKTHLTDTDKPGSSANSPTDSNATDKTSQDSSAEDSSNKTNADTDSSAQDNS